MNTIQRLGSILFLLIGLYSSAQTFVWTGVTNNDFFTESNWKNSSTNALPAANTINPGAGINFDLQINATATITASGSIQFGTGSLVVGTTVGAVNLSATSLSGGTATINENGYVELTATTPFLNNVQINFTSGIGWVKARNSNPKSISTNNLLQIKVNNIAAVYQTNLRLDHYYEKGCIIRANLATTSPLTVFDGTNLQGPSSLVTVNTIHSHTAIPNAMNNRIESFILKKGYMVTMANEIDGTGKSFNYIASEADLTINTVPATMINNISFIRVVPWNWVSKKGVNVASSATELNATWRYQWSASDVTVFDYEFAPMSWGDGSIDSAADVASFVGKYNSPYAMSFNEPDDCFAQSGQYGNPKLCTIDKAVRIHKNFMKTGMRIVSPGGREEAPFGWLKDFYNTATAQDIRIDVIAIHWYDWGSSPTTTDNATGDQVFARFKNYLTRVYNAYGLPIWITEFNANPARSQAVNARFLELALPYLESLDYIERYCWFPFNSTTHFSGWDDATRTETNKIPSLVGTIYKNINNTTPVQSTAAVPESTFSAASSLNVGDFPNVAFRKPVTASSTYSTFVPSYAVDGDKTTVSKEWQVQFSTKPLPAWLEVDLQGTFTLYGFRIIEEAKAIKDCQFQVWDKTLNSGAGGWTTSLTITTNLATSLTTYRTLTTPVTTTKVRLYVTAHNDTAFMKMFEFEVYGLPRNATWTGGTSTNWATATNWSNGILPDDYSNVSIPAGTTFQPIIAANSKINSLTIATGASVTVNSGVNFTIVDTIINDGTMTMSNNANLLQGETFNNIGNVTIIRDSNPLSRLDYTIWSSPVTNANRFLTTFSPLTFANRFYTYNQSTNRFNTILNPAATPFALGIGYLIRMPDNAVTAPLTQVFQGVFTGVPNNSTISVPVRPGVYWDTSKGFNTLGNPYPSTLDATKFIDANGGKPLYFWRKKNAGTGSAYATWNKTGAVGTSSSDIPSGTIQIGQGFIMQTSQTYAQRDWVTKDVNFNNDMRLGTNSTQFFKTKQEEKDRLWLNLTNASGVFSQTLVGYFEEATMAVDEFDGRYINDSPIAITSKINDEEFVIQGRPAFNVSDAVDLNFKTDVAGDYTVALDHFEGVFAKGQDIYLLDSKTGIETNLKNGSYTFNSLAGIDNNRFSLKYQKTLNVNTPSFNENNVRIYKNNGTLYVNSLSVDISNIKVYDLQGRLIAEQKNVKATTAVLKNLKATHQVLIVKVTAEDNNVVSKKVVN
ncbi:glycosyl hydrolase [Flavobacterium sp.]|uniref:glycosyl hydrolase n=1 Tax=Flavobacterium sp. TaxID=239 RepID=UPI00286E9435|nr:glycosyl hydrolase [Flavobacterium sp.]